ncbi:MAG: hypothetical protein AAFR87_26465 [Bacteroidota bacterium]
MGTRSERFSGKRLHSEAKSLLGKEAHVILWEGSTYFGDLIDVEEGRIKLRDKNARWYNLNNHTHDFDIEKIREVIVDRNSTW